MLRSAVARRDWLRVILLFGFAAALAACGGARKIVTEDFAEGRVVDLSITEKLTGSQDLLFFSVPKKTKFLEGYIQGVITDYDDNPIQGVVVRAVPAEESQLEDDDTGARSQSYAVSSFDPGVSDTNGFYRIRFTLPILSGIVDVRGKLLYNPGWDQERDTLGKAYEPQLKQSQFRLYYEQGRGRITFVEGIRKTIVKPVFGAHAGKVAAGGGAAQPAGDAADKPADSKSNDDLFKGFGFQ